MKELTSYLQIRQYAIVAEDHQVALQEVLRVGVDPGGVAPLVPFEGLVGVEGLWASLELSVTTNTRISQLALLILVLMLDD